MEAANEKKAAGRFDFITKRRAYWLALALVAGAAFGARLVLRYVYDRRLDEPKRFEQVVWMDSAWGWRQDTLRVWLSHLGKPKPGRKKVTTQLIGISNADGAISLAALRRSYLRLAPATVTSDNLYVTLAPAAPHESIVASFEALAKAGYASRQAGTFWKPAVYSFAIRARLENSRQVFRRTYHFRSWAPAEVTLFWFGLLIGIYLAATLSIRGVTALANNPRRPIDLSRDWLSRLWMAARVWWLRHVVCRRIAKSLKWVAEGLTLLAAIANISGAQFVPVANVLGLLAALAAVMKLIGISRSEQLDGLRKRVEEKQHEMKNRQEIGAGELQRLARVVRELEALQKICTELEPAAVAEAGKELEEASARLRESIKRLRREFERAYRQETKRRAALKAAIAAKIEEARRGIAARILAYLQSQDFRGKAPLFDQMVREEEFKQKVQDPELVFLGERKEEQTEYKLISLQPLINSERGEPLITLRVTKEGANFRVQQFADAEHPVRVTALPLPQRPSQEAVVKFEVRFGELMLRLDEPLPAAEKLPVSLDNPDPNYAAWYAELPPLRKFLQADSPRIPL